MSSLAATYDMICQIHLFSFRFKSLIIITSKLHQLHAVEYFLDTITC